MLTHLATLLTAATLFSPSQSQASTLSFAYLQDICSSSNENNVNACRFYIFGVTQGLGLAAGIAGDRTHFCVPDNVTSEEMVLVVRRNMIADAALYPKDKSLPAVSFVAAVMMKNYPCK